MFIFAVKYYNLFVTFVALLADGFNFDCNSIEMNKELGKVKTLPSHISPLLITFIINSCTVKLL